MPGLFIPLYPAAELEYATVSYHNTKDKGVLLKAGIEKIREFIFLPGEKFSKLERALFLGLLLRFPIKQGRISSYYGERKDPFTCSTSFHNGIDIAAPENTEVIAARGGIVEKTGSNEVLGNYVVISHQSGYETVYGHLNFFNVRLNQIVTSGMIIGAVGNTGLSTGPHLHFEIRRLGETRNPLPLFSGEYSE